MSEIKQPSGAPAQKVGGMRVKPHAEHKNPDAPSGVVQTSLAAGLNPPQTVILDNPKAAEEQSAAEQDAAIKRAHQAEVQRTQPHVPSKEPTREVGHKPATKIINQPRK
eukprot:TRINITY_DN3546_c0_g2_i1.p2 TRINITY_DN3546_c0_g2~~TRINITY_DN3546_c0_g2_i1.p2  ORF type:complete len:109 (+),score=31.36 TRINITY_DN3546_c0_g2_i1:121-447(+)